MKKLGLTTKILIGFVLGILLGIVFKEQVLIIKPIGDIFLTLVKMIVVPLVFFSITSGVASIGDIKRLTKIGSKTILYFIVTTAVAGVVGCIISNVLQPGAGVDLSGIVAGGSVKAKQMPTLGATILGMLFFVKHFSPFSSFHIPIVIIGNSPLSAVLVRIQIPQLHPAA